jgi:type II secretory pathway predicted ATPase ExeA/ankyrin repeat protein
MYLSYFGCREQPFHITPDPRFFYANEGYEEAYANLLYGIRERKGFIVLTGEVGTGKTTLLRRLMDELGNSVHFVFFYNTKLTFEEMLDFICQDFGLSVVSQASRLQKIQALNEFLLARLAEGGTGVLLIDEAQNLGDEVLENLRLLSNLETAREKLLQIVLVGQPELYRKLTQPHLRQLKQRVVVWCNLGALPDCEVEAFITYRLRLAGCERLDLFSSEAVQRIAFYAGGTPRLINVICDNALLIAYGTSQRQVSADIIEEVAEDLGLRRGTKIPTWKPLTRPQPLLTARPTRPASLTAKIEAGKPSVSAPQSSPATEPVAPITLSAPKEAKGLPASVTMKQPQKGAAPASSPGQTRQNQFRKILLVASLVICILTVGEVLSRFSFWHGSDPRTVSTQATLPSLETPADPQADAPSAPTIQSYPPLIKTPFQEATPPPILETETEPFTASATPAREQAPSSDEHEPLSRQATSPQQDATPPSTEIPTPAPSKELDIAATPLQKKPSPLRQSPSQVVPDLREQSPTKTGEQSAQEPAMLKKTFNTQVTPLRPKDGDAESTARQSSTPSEQEEARLELERRGLTRDGASVLISAERGDADTLGLLLAAGAPPDARDAKGWNALMLATLRGQTSTARTLLANGANVNEKNEAGGTALMMAATTGDQDIIQELLDNGAAVNTENRQGWTPLMYAAWNGHDSAVRLLLDKKADMNAKNQEGWTPLMCAVSKGHTAIVQTLLSRGANARLPNENGETALQLATRLGYADIVTMLQSAEADE